MHTMSFRVPADMPLAAAEDLLKSSIAGGHDRAPTATRCELREGHLVLTRELGESGPAYVPWPVPRLGRLVTPTTTLMFRDRPYDLATELARGKVNQVRNQYADWHGGGLAAAPDVEEILHRATNMFGSSILEDTFQSADRQADEALAIAHEAADSLVRRYEEQVFRLRHQRQPRLDTALGCRIGAVPPRGIDDAYRLAFNAAYVPMTWRSIEPTESGYRWTEADATINWAASRNLPLFAGPLIDFSANGLPEYVLKLRGEPLSFKSLMSDYVETVVGRYRGKVTRWLITAGSNGSGALGFSEEDLIRLTAMAADAAWQIDSSLQLVFGLAQPWGDYLGASGFDYSPFVFADTLLRSGLPFAGVEVEWFFGTSSRGSYCRDLLSASQLLDLFGVLGVPIHVSLAYPSSTKPDPQGDPTEYIERAGRWRDFTPAAQADWAGAFAALAMCKTYVSGVFWDHLMDAAPHRIPNGGLVDERGQVKPAFERLRALREAHLK
jgi:Glycosyl hydrolase family 10